MVRIVIPALLLSAFGLLPSCTSWNDNSIRIGRSWDERLIAATPGQRTLAGVVAKSNLPFGGARYLLVLLTKGDEIAARFVVEQRPGQGRTGDVYSLDGQFDAARLALDGHDVLEGLRALADRFATQVADDSSRDAQRLVAVGLVRILQRWPGRRDEGPAMAHLFDLLPVVAPGGEAKLGVTGPGVWIVQYQVRN